MTNKYEIYAGACVGCGRCKPRCAVNAIVRDGDKFKIDSTRCVACGNCYRVCPAGAITRD